MQLTRLFYQYKFKALYMTFKIKRFSTIRIFSAKVAKSRDWYVSFLGMDPVEDLEGFVSFEIQNVRFDIIASDLKSPFSKGGSVGYFLVDDLDELIKKCIELEGAVYRGPLRVEESQRTIVQIIDPFGNVIGFESEF